MPLVVMLCHLRLDYSVTVLVVFAELWIILYY